MVWDLVYVSRVYFLACAWLRVQLLIWHSSDLTGSCRPWAHGCLLCGAWPASLRAEAVHTNNPCSLSSLEGVKVIGVQLYSLVWGPLGASRGNLGRVVKLFTQGLDG